MALRCVALRCVTLRCVALRCVAGRCCNSDYCRVRQKISKELQSTLEQTTKDKAEARAKTEEASGQLEAKSREVKEIKEKFVQLQSEFNKMKQSE